MQFEKKLIILSGAAAKGTLTLERNAFGLFAALNVYNLPDLKNGEYCVGIKTAEKAFVHKVGVFGGISIKFRLEEAVENKPEARDGAHTRPAELGRIHCVIFESEKGIPLLYGTSAPVKLWAGNMMDGFRSKKVEATKEAAKTEHPLPFPPYSGRKQEVRDYFFDITPGERIEVPVGSSASPLLFSDSVPESAEPVSLSREPEGSEPACEAERLLSEARALLSEYNDQALAEVNYFAKGVAYSRRNAVDPDELLNPVDRYLRDGERTPELSPPTAFGGNGYAAESGMDGCKNEPCSAKTAGERSDGDENFEDYARKGEAAVQYAREYLTRSRSAGVKKSNCAENSVLEGMTGISAGLHGARTSGIHKSAVSDSETPKQIGALPSDSPLARAENSSAETAKRADSEAAFTVPPVSDYHAAFAAAAPLQSVFYEQIKTQLDELFASCERFTLLEKLMPETQWVRVDFDESKFYVVGLIGKKPDYICYGVPAEYAPYPPAELGDGCRWLPEDPEDAGGKGFWLMFQDAATGEAEG